MQVDGIARTAAEQFYSSVMQESISLISSTLTARSSDKKNRCEMRALAITARHPLWQNRQNNSHAYGDCSQAAFPCIWPAIEGKATMRFGEIHVSQSTDATRYRGPVPFTLLVSPTWLGIAPLESARAVDDCRA